MEETPPAATPVNSVASIAEQLVLDRNKSKGNLPRNHAVTIRLDAFAYARLDAMADRSEISPTKLATMLLEAAISESAETVIPELVANVIDCDEDGPVVEMVHPENL